MLPLSSSERRTGHSSWRTYPLLYLTLTALVVLAPAAHTTTPENVRLGKDIFLNDLLITTDGHTETISAHPLTKPAGSLQLQLPLSLFGSSGGTISAAGQLNQDRIRRGFNQALSINLGGGTELRRVYGHFELQTSAYTWFERAVCEDSEIGTRTSRWLVPKRIRV